MKVRFLAASAVLAVAAGGGAVAAATAASAATTTTATLSVTLESSSDAYTYWNPTVPNTNEPVLVVGKNTSSTYALMWVNGNTAGSPVSGTAVPGSEPTFDTDNYAAGSPRWVIDLSNGKSLWGYPSESGLNGTDEAWTVDNGNTYGSYAAAVTSAGGSSLTVKDAYIVADGDQAPGTKDTLRNVMYDNMTLPGPGAVGTIKSDYSGKCLNDAGYSTADGNSIVQWNCGSYTNEQWTFNVTQNTSWGTQIGYLENNASNKCLNDAGYGGPGSDVVQWDCGNYSNELWQYWPAYHEYSLYSGSRGVCLNDPDYSTANGTQQIVWNCVNTANEHYTQP